MAEETHKALPAPKATLALPAPKDSEVRLRQMLRGLIPYFRKWAA